MATRGGGAGTFLGVWLLVAASCPSCAPIGAAQSECPPGHREITAAPSQTQSSRAVGCVDANGSWDGAYRELFDDGSVAAQGHYSAGVADLDWEFRYPSGRKMQVGKFVAGRREGLWTSYYEDGTHLGAGPFHADLPDGHWLTWHTNGERQSEGDYRNGHEDGAWTFWFPNGQIESTGEFQGRRSDPPRNADVPARSGLWQYWYENGGRRLAGCFEHGHQVGTWTEWSERGEARTVATYPSARQECKTQTEETAR